MPLRKIVSNIRFYCIANQFLFDYVDVCPGKLFEFMQPVDDVLKRLLFVFVIYLLFEVRSLGRFSHLCVVNVFLFYNYVTSCNL